MKYLLIGSGFIGSKLKARLEKNGAEVEVFDMAIDPKQNICDREYVSMAIKKEKYDSVILMAAIADLNVFEAQPLLGMDVNIGGVINVAQACMETKQRLVYISTCCVYGNTQDLPSTEEARANPSEIYAAAKLAGEWIIKGYNLSYDMPYAILRIATCYGPGMRGALAPAVFIDKVKKGEPITIHGDGNQTRTLTYIDDEVEGIARVIESEINNQTFNISNEEESSVNELATAVKEAMNAPDHPLDFIQDRKGQTFKEQISTKKMKDLLDWQATIQLKEGIKNSVEWVESQRS